MVIRYSKKILGSGGGGVGLTRKGSHRSILSCSHVRSFCAYSMSSLQLRSLRPASRISGHHNPDRTNCPDVPACASGQHQDMCGKACARTVVRHGEGLTFVRTTFPEISRFRTPDIVRIVLPGRACPMRPDRTKFCPERCPVVVRTRF